MEVTQGMKSTPNFKSLNDCISAAHCLVYLVHSLTTWHLICHKRSRSYRRSRSQLSFGKSGSLNLMVT